LLPLWLARILPETLLSDLGRIDMAQPQEGNQVGYENEDPRILQLYERELAKYGVESRMDRFFPARRGAR
jgi:hypothetical protein